MSPLAATPRALLLGAIFLTIASSGYLLVQPAPTDYLAIFSLTLWLALARPKPPMPWVPLILLGLWVLTDLAQLVLRRTWPDPEAARYYSTLDALMLVLVILVVAILQSYGQTALLTIVSAYLVAAVASVMPSLMTLMGIWQVEQTLYYKLRLRGFFAGQNHTNDFGLFMAIGVVLALYLGRYGPQRFRWVGYGLCPLLLSGVILSYSRAAWVVLAVVLLLLMLLNFFSLKRWYLVWLALAVGAGVVGIAFVKQPRLYAYFQTRFALQHYDDERFGFNQQALEVGLRTPLGVGIGQAHALLDYLVHNLYARVLYENGWLGFLAIIGFLALTLYRLIQKLRTYGTNRPVYAMLLALTVGLLINGMVVDPITDRFHWLVLALAWGEY